MSCYGEVALLVQVPLRALPSRLPRPCHLFDLVLLPVCRDKTEEGFQFSYSCTTHHPSVFENTVVAAAMITVNVISERPPNRMAKLGKHLHVSGETCLLTSQGSATEACAKSNI